MPIHLRWTAIALTGVLAGCQPAQDASPTGAAAGPAAAQAAAEPAPAPMDEAGERAAAARALAEQRLYAPAGDNAVEHYLALRDRLPGDRGIETALLELLPYALIGSEQAISRGDFDEARRLVALVQRADARLPALGRLRDRLVAAEAEARLAAERAAREAELAAEREAQARLAATSVPPGTATGEVPAAVPARALPTNPGALAGPAAASTPAVATASQPAATPSPAARPAAATPPPVPKLLSAPQPRYPLMALRRKAEGDVVLELRIEADGSVGEARVLSANPPGLFDEAAVAAASRWRFETGPSVVTTRQVLRFRLPKEG